MKTSYIIFTLTPSIDVEAEIYIREREKILQGVRFLSWQQKGSQDLNEYLFDSLFDPIQGHLPDLITEKGYNWKIHIPQPTSS